MLCVMCSVFTIHYKHIVEVLEKTKEYIHSKGNFMERAMGCVKT